MQIPMGEMGEAVARPTNLSYVGANSDAFGAGLARVATEFGAEALHRQEQADRVRGANLLLDHEVGRERHHQINVRARSARSARRPVCHKDVRPGRCLALEVEHQAVTPARIKELTLKRKLLADDPASAAIVRSIDNLLRSAAKAKRQPRRSGAVNAERLRTLASIPNGDQTELRVCISGYAGKRRVDLRLWFVPSGESEFVPSRKGVSIDAQQLAAVIAALQEARSLVTLPAEGLNGRG